MTVQAWPKGKEAAEWNTRQPRQDRAGSKSGASMDRILVVDDEAVIRELLTEILEGEGYEVDAFSGGHAALEQLREQPDYVLLFTDIMMPEMDGISLLREARQVSPSLISIVMTGFATLETARAAVKEGAYDYVLKPFSLTEIKLAVSNAFERYRLSSENSRLQEVTQLFHISETIAGIRNERQLLDYVLEAALERVGARRGSIMMLTTDGSALQIAASRGLPEEARNKPVQLNAGISGWVAENKKPLLVKNIKKNPQLEEISHRLRDDSFISVPLESKHAAATNGNGRAALNGRLLAVLNVTEKLDGARFNEGDLKLLSIMANQAASAIDNVRLIQEIEQAHISSLESMARLLEAKDAYTHGHSERVRDYCVMAAHLLGFSRQDIDALRLGAMLHDIGKVGVRDDVLNKIDPLTNDEWEMIKSHPVIGYEILKNVPSLPANVLSLVRSHHERLDGSGYPDGIGGNDLTSILRVICVADSYDAMATSRAYRTGLPMEAILDQLRRGAREGKLDQDVCGLFVDLASKGELEQAALQYREA